MIFPVYLFAYAHMQAHLRVHGEVRGLADEIQILRLSVQRFYLLSILSKPFYDLELDLIQSQVLAFQSSCLQESSVSDLVLEITFDNGSETIQFKL